MSTQQHEARAGGDIDAYCGKCQLVLAHVVMAMNGSKVVRVKCKTCQAEHAMRKTAPGKAKKAGPSKAGGGTGKSTGGVKAAQRKAEARVQAAFDTACEGKDLAAAKRYRSSVAFDAGDVLDHPTFGLGVVERLLSDRKVQVIFQSAGERLLVHDRA